MFAHSRTCRSRWVLAPLCSVVLFIFSPALGWSQSPESTPRSTLLGFLAQAQRQDFTAAAQFLNAKSSSESAVTLAQELSVVIDRRLFTNLEEISNEPDGRLNDNLPANQESIGFVKYAHGTVPILLERVTRDDGKVWLFSSETLDLIPEIYAEITPSMVDDVVPGWLSTGGWMGIPYWQWIAIPIGIIVIIAISGVLRGVVGPLLRRILGTVVDRQDDALLGGLAIPLRLLILLAISHVIIALLHLPLLARQFWMALASRLALVTFLWLFVRLVGVFGTLLGRRLNRAGRTNSTALIRLVQRTINIIAVVLVVAALLRGLGFDVTALLAGLGVGGIAVAFAAQKTLENLFSGIFIIFDKVIRVGDLCRIAGQDGHVEDIGLRSTRIRTLDRTLVTVPNGQLSTMNLENFGVRDKIRFYHVVGIRCDTTLEQLDTVLAGIRALLDGREDVERHTARVSLIRLGPSSIDIEVTAYLMTTDATRFFEAQERMLLAILSIVERAGTATALPAQVLYLNRDALPSRAGAVASSQ